MRIFIGYDSTEDIAYRVCEYSIRKYQPDIQINPIVQKELRDRGEYTRPENEPASTEFSFTRFLTPKLSDYKGWSLFCDCDFLFLEDVQKLFDLCDDKYAVMVVKHDHRPKHLAKMDGHRMQIWYPCKNWSSLVLWNCEHPSNRNIDVNGLGGKDLHRFCWLHESEIGDLPVEWNWLVGYDEDIWPYKDPNALHYTEGGPWFDRCKDCDWADAWNSMKDEMENENRSI